MIPVIVVRKPYNLKEDNYLWNACKYVLDDRAIHPGGYGVSPYKLQTAYEQMLAIKKYYGKTSGNQLIHLIISYDSLVTAEGQACALSCKLASYYQNSYQVLFCTHAKDRSCSNYHMHMIVNSVSYRDGKMFNSSIENMNQFCDYVTNVTGRRSRVYFGKESEIQKVTKEADEI